MSSQIPTFRQCLEDTPATHGKSFMPTVEAAGLVPGVADTSLGVALGLGPLAVDTASTAEVGAAVATAASLDGAPVALPAAVATSLRGAPVLPTPSWRYTPGALVAAWSL